MVACQHVRCSWAAWLFLSAKRFTAKTRSWFVFRLPGVPGQPRYFCLPREALRSIFQTWSLFAFRLRGVPEQHGCPRGGQTAPGYLPHGHAAPRPVHKPGQGHRVHPGLHQSAVRQDQAAWTATRSGRSVSPQAGLQYTSHRHHLPLATVMRSCRQLGPVMVCEYSASASPGYSP